MNHAQTVEKQVKDLYSYGANYHDIANHLTHDRVDVGLNALHKSTGFDRSHDESLTVFYYADGSILVVNSSYGLSASS